MPIGHQNSLLSIDHETGCTSARGWRVSVERSWNSILDSHHTARDIPDRHLRFEAITLLARLSERRAQGDRADQGKARRYKFIIRFVSSSAYTIAFLSRWTYRGWFTEHGLRSFLGYRAGAYNEVSFG